MQNATKWFCLPWFTGRAIRVLILLAIGMLAVLSPVSADDDFDPDDMQDKKIWDIPARFDTQIRGSKDRLLNILDYWQPLSQTIDHVTFTTMRVMNDNQTNVEGSVGFGARGFFGDHIWGGYAYADRRFTALGSEFWQATLGSEYIREDIEGRLNVYLPTHRRNVYQTASSDTPLVAGTGIYIQSPTTRIEEAQPGLDAEVGFKIPDFSKYVGTSRAYVGAYYFKGDETPDVTGGRVRIKSDITTFLQIGARAQYDAERGAQYFAEVTFHFPGVIHRPDRPSLWSRLADIPERDVDIVTAERNQVGSRTPLTDQETGAPARFVYVDQRADPPSADGSVEHPFPTISGALAIARPYDTVYIAANPDETKPYDEGIVLATDHLMLHGAGVPLVLPHERYVWASGLDRRDVILYAGTAAPILTNSTGDVITVTGTGQTIQGVHLDGAAGAGVMITDGAQDVTLQNMTVTGNDTHGVVIYRTRPDEQRVTIRDTSIIGNLQYGVLAESLNGGRLTIDMGTIPAFGGNDIFGNITGDMYVHAPASTIAANGNYWGATTTPNIVGPNARPVDTRVVATSAFCTACEIEVVPFAPWVSNVDPTHLYASAQQMLFGFSGSRYVAVSTFDAGLPPDWIVNGQSAGSYVRIRSGDTIGFTVMPQSSSLYTRFVTIWGSGFDQFIGIQTQ